MSDFAGDWITTFGHMSLSQDGSNVRGVYHMGPNECTLEGTIQQGVLHFRYREPAVGGEGWFVLQRPGKFVGQWRQDGTNTWQIWQGERGFEGIWQSSFGPLRLVVGEDGVHGFYEGLGKSTITGKLEGNRLVFRYREPRAQGEGWFELAGDSMTFQGQWRRGRRASLVSVGRAAHRAGAGTPLAGGAGSLLAARVDRKGVRFRQHAARVFRPRA